MNNATNGFIWKTNMFDSLDELIEKIYSGEDSTIEFKGEMPHRNSLADEIAAFANTRGGVILIGVNDEQEIVGMNVQSMQDCEKTVVEICQDSIDPSVHIFTQKMEIADKHVLKIEVKPSFFVHKTTNGYFVRQGSSKREMDTQQLARLLQSRSQTRMICFDEQLVPNTGKGTLQKDLYARFISNTETEEQENEMLLKRRLLVEDGNLYRASVAGLLMCSHQSDTFLYNSFICAVCYRGKERDANYQIDAEDFKGPLDRQILDAFRFVDKHNQKSARKEIWRKEQAQYSMRAIFEALVNAVVHRDYSKHGSKIRLFLFSDRLELYSPGALANTLTVDKLAYNQITRNELLARLLSDLKIDDDNLGKEVHRQYFLERRGEGVGIILGESERLSGKLPIYQMHNEELCLTIYAANSLQAP